MLNENALFGDLSSLGLSFFLPFHCFGENFGLLEDASLNERQIDKVFPLACKKLFPWQLTLNSDTGFALERPLVHLLFQAKAF